MEDIKVMINGMTYTSQEALAAAQQMSMEDPARAVCFMESLLSQVSSKEDIPYLAQLYYELGSSYFDIYNSRQCVNNVLRSITYYKELDDWNALAQCYNVLGISYTNQGDMASAIDAYTSELELAQQHDLFLPQMKAYINLGSTCYEIARYDEAMSYSSHALDIYQGQEARQQFVNYRIFYLSLMGKALSRQGRITEARQVIERLDELLRETPRFENTPFDTLPHFFLRLNEAHDRVSASLLDDTIAPFKEQELASDYIPETIELMQELQRLGEFSRLRELFPVLEQSLQPTDYYGYKLRLSRFKIDYCRHTRDADDLIREIGTFCDCLDKHNDVSADTIISYLNAKASLNDARVSNLRLERSNRKLEAFSHELEEHNQLLQQYANTDVLTEISNRRDLNETSDHLFELARKERSHFGFEMLDIDNFKDVNDTYGHEVGDRCLKLLADILKEVSSEKIYCARYGGDEFVLLYLGMTDEQILQVSKKLHSQVQTRSGRSGIPAFTISQGICNRRVRPKEKLWDISSAADEALYNVKEGGRNGTLLVN